MEVGVLCLGAASSGDGERAQEGQTGVLPAAAGHGESASPHSLSFIPPGQETHQADGGQPGRHHHDRGQERERKVEREGAGARGRTPPRPHHPLPT